ncbi:hypothetical protein PLICRDRAFT_150407 [Plicaturopsis crispa FD-325 SS-3]|nr:hypothetical protein PLICRDRAFT_150407 [Plicaturopsis crispa FD-325 SS-3]
MQAGPVKVEDTLFKVPKRCFANRSEIFNTIFALPPGDRGTTDGTSDEKPFVLERVNKVDFENLMKAMYPLISPPTLATKARGDRNGPSEVSLSLDEWISVLKLSTMWGFFDIRQHAIMQLTPLLEDEAAVVDKLVFAKTYKVSDWLSTGYHTLARRQGLLSKEERMRLTDDTAIRVYEVREDFVAKTDAKGKLVSSRSQHDFSAAIERIFVEELKEIKSHDEEAWEF